MGDGCDSGDTNCPSNASSFPEFMESESGGGGCDSKDPIEDLSNAPPPPEPVEDIWAHLDMIWVRRWECSEV